MEGLHAPDAPIELQCPSSCRGDAARACGHVGLNPTCRQRTKKQLLRTNGLNGLLGRVAEFLDCLDIPHLQIEVDFSASVTFFYIFLVGLLVFIIQRSDF